MTAPNSTLLERLPPRLLERALVPAFYRSSTCLMALVLRLFAAWRVDGVEHIPRSGAFILVANHLSMADPPLLGASVPRPLRFMAKEELFQTSLGGACVRLFGAFPVRRLHSDVKALRTAERLLRAGSALGLFPEGHRSHGLGLQRALPGAAVLTLRTGCPILPVGITGTERIRSVRVLLQRPHIGVAIGSPLTFPRPERLNAETVQATTERIMLAIAELLPAPYRGVYTQNEVR